MLRISAPISSNTPYTPDGARAQLYILEKALKRKKKINKERKKKEKENVCASHVFFRAK